MRALINSTLTHHADGTARHRSIAGVLRHFSSEHLPPAERWLADRFAQLGIAMADELAGNWQLIWGLRQTLSAYDEVRRMFFSRAK